MRELLNTGMVIASPFHDSWQPLSESELTFKILQVGVWWYDPLGLLALVVNARLKMADSISTLHPSMVQSFVIAFWVQVVLVALFPVERLNNLN
jgi:hypothetical protein